MIERFIGEREGERESTSKLHAHKKKSDYVLLRPKVLGHGREALWRFPDMIFKAGPRKFAEKQPQKHVRRRGPILKLGVAVGTMLRRMPIFLLGLLQKTLVDSGRRTPA